MEEHVAAIRAGQAAERIWLLEHAPLYTRGTSAKTADLLDARFPVYEAGRGGEYTYHGPGQRVAYVMLDLKKRYAPGVPDIRDFVRRLERWIIAALAELGVEAFTREGRIGVWVDRGAGSRLQASGSNNASEAKVAALGIRVRRGVSYHGVAVNVNPDLSHYGGIVPCGIREYGVTSLERLGVTADMRALDAALKKTFDAVFA
jgi:lipoyl(octanoyl) transferase